MAISSKTGENKMKKILFFVIFIFLAVALMANAKEPKKIYKLTESLCFFGGIPADFGHGFELFLFYQGRYAAGYPGLWLHISLLAERKEFSDNDNLIIDKGSKDGLKEGDLLMIMSQGKHPSSRPGPLFPEKIPG